MPASADYNNLKYLGNLYFNNNSNLAFFKIFDDSLAMTTKNYDALFFFKKLYGLLYYLNFFDKSKLNYNCVTLASPTRADTVDFLIPKNYLNYYFFNYIRVRGGGLTFWDSSASFNSWLERNSGYELQNLTIVGGSGVKSSPTYYYNHS